ncbi:hypothetical protein [Parendozoicomonas haliclonae]|uniref:Uncharacterized protein n=1 Tax=Parendozoicomonas haliclonae TaxID=1960125 RepID=A0A1X7AJF5_9GAMM|nr:hypothetical protein [Parendozoicomonas haliclonae]SMA45887.1 hypothetical protein EHSB41UT_02020 [Parendozoicomonas haliclonae]
MDDRVHFRSTPTGATVDLDSKKTMTDGNWQGSHVAATRRPPIQIPPAPTRTKDETTPLPERKTENDKGIDVHSALSAARRSAVDNLYEVRCSIANAFFIYAEETPKHLPSEGVDIPLSVISINGEAVIRTKSSKPLTENFKRYYWLSTTATRHKLRQLCSTPYISEAVKSASSLVCSWIAEPLQSLNGKFRLSFDVESIDITGDDESNEVKVHYELKYTPSIISQDQKYPLFDNMDVTMKAVVTLIDGHPIKEPAFLKINTKSLLLPKPQFPSQDPKTETNTEDDPDLFVDDLIQLDD